MKKIICLLLVIMMLVPNVVLASSLEDVTLSVKERIDIPSELTKFSSNIRTYEGAGTSYTLSWTNEESDKNIEITVNERGDITRYYIYDRSAIRNDVGMSKFEKSYFVDTAKAFIEKINPSWIDDLNFDTEVNLSYLYSETVDVEFYREINGLRFCDNYASVSINKYTGDVVRFYSNWTYADAIPDTEKMLSDDELKKVFEEKSGLALKYMAKRDSTEAILVYVPKNSSLILDAITGEEITLSELYYGNMKETVGSNSAMRDEAVSEGLTKEELEEIARMDSLISIDKAKSIASSIENTNIKKLKLTNTEYIKRKDGEDYKYVLSMSFEGENSYASITLDAKDGSLLSLYSYEDISKTDKKISNEKLRQHADKFISKYAPDIADKVDVFEETSPRFKYSESVNGVEYASNNAYVTVNEYTGNITQYSRVWNDNVTFESIDGIASNEDALSVLYDKIGFDKYYLNTNDGVKIGFRLNNNIPHYIDANELEILSHNLEKYAPESKTYGTAIDLEGHYAKKYIDALMENGIIKYEETFRPDDTVTVKEALEFLNCLDGGYVPYDKANYMYIDLSKRIFGDNEYDENALVTREHAAKFIVKARSDYGEIAEMKIFDSGFDDRERISDGYEGYVAILKGMGIIQGDEMGCFNPLNEITRADFSILLYKILNK